MKLLVIRFIAVFFLSAVAISCSTSPTRPVAEIALADSAIISAIEAGAEEYAPIELRQAREKKQAAQDAILRSEYAKAKRLTEQARVDAEHARAVAEAEQAKRALFGAQDNIQLLKHVIADENATE